MQPQIVRLKRWINTAVRSRTAPLFAIAFLLAVGVFSLRALAQQDPDIDIDVNPRLPTTEDNIRIRLSGQWPYPCPPRYESHQVDGDEIVIIGEDISEIAICDTTPPVPWSFTVQIGRLEAGYYTVHARIVSATNERIVAEETEGFEVLGDAEIWGTVFEDTDEDGVMDVREEGLASVTVVLRDSSRDRDIGTRRTDRSGHYRFPDLEPGTYEVIETDPAGYTSTTPNSVEVEVEVGDTERVDFGDVIMVMYGQVVWEETCFTDVSAWKLTECSSGSQYWLLWDYIGDDIPPGTWGVKLTLPFIVEDWCDGLPRITDYGRLERISSCADGGQDCATHHFRGEVIETEPAEHAYLVTITEILSETDDYDIDVGDQVIVDAEAEVIDSDPEAGDIVEVQGHYGRTPCVPMPPPPTSCDAEGIVVRANCDESLDVIGQVAGSIWGFVFEDEDQDGVFDSNEPRLGGATVTLREVPDGADLQTSTTNPYTGRYEFNDVEPGTYYVVEEDLRGYGSTTANTVEVQLEANGSSRVDFGDVHGPDVTFRGRLTRIESLIGGTTWTVQIYETISGPPLDSQVEAEWISVPECQETERDPDLQVNDLVEGHGVFESADSVYICGSGYYIRQVAEDVTFTGTVTAIVNNANEYLEWTVEVDEVISGSGLDSEVTVYWTEGGCTGTQWDIVEVGDAVEVHGIREHSGSVYVCGSGYYVRSNEQAGSIHGTVFEDNNRNGVMDDDESGLNDVVIALREDRDGQDVDTQTTDDSGFYQFPAVPAGTYYLVETDPPNYTSTTPNTHLIEVLPGESNEPVNFGDVPSGPRQPIIRSVGQCIFGPYFLEGYEVQNRFDVDIDWQGTPPGDVKFILNGARSSKTASSEIVSHTYDMGNDLQYSPKGIQNLLKIVATSDDGATSPPYLVTINGLTAPDWVSRDLEVDDPNCKQGPVTFSKSFDFDLSGQVTPPDWTPFFNGDPIGLKRTEASLGLEVTSDGNGAGEFSGQTGFTALGQEGDGEIFGQGHMVMRLGEGLVLSDAGLGLKLSTALKKTVGVADAIPALRAVGETPLIGEPVKWLNDNANLEGKLKPAINAQLHFHRGSTDSRWEWDNVTGGTSLRMTLALVVDLIDDWFTARAFGGGTPSITLQVPPSPSYLKEVALELLFGVEVEVWRLKEQFQASHKKSYSPSAGSYASSAGDAQMFSESTGWQPVPRTYAATPSGYSVFHAAVPLQYTHSMDNGTTDQTLIASNVYPYADPALAVGDSQTLLLWTHDDIDKPLMQGEEVRYTAYDGSRWSAPIDITDDRLEDFTPQVAFDGFGHAVAVWERMRRVKDVDATLDITYTQDLEIAYALWDGAAWTEPHMLTDNTVLDHAPVLTKGHDGKLMLLWRENARSELIGSEAEPDTLHTTVWDGSNWSNTTALNIADSFGRSLAYYDDSSAVLVYTRDVDGDLSTGNDQELYAVTWNGTDWGGPTRLTNDNQPDGSPTVLYDEAGVVKLLWLKGDTLYYLSGALSGEGRPVTEEGSAGMLDYRAALDPAGNVAVIWQGLSEQGADAYYSVYDAATDSFSLRAQLTDDQPLEKMMSPAFEDTGQLWMAFAKDELVNTSVTVSPTLEIDNVTTFGQSDLYVLRHSLGPDLALEARDIVVTPTNPELGSTATISATVHNLGDLAVSDVQIDFYQGDPAAGGTQIGGTQIVPSTLGGGMEETVSVQWSVPLTIEAQSIYVVADPADDVGEWDETNNQAFTTAVAPDLRVDNAWVNYGASQAVTLTATISNTGVVAATDSAVAFRLDNPDGNTVAQAPLDDLASGAQTVVSAVWDGTAAATDWHTVYAVVDPSETIPEADEDNNNEWLSVALLPDLAIRSTDISATHDENSVVLTATVYNQGMRDAIGTTLGLYGTWPQVGDVPNAQTQIDVPAGGSTTTSLTWNGKWWPGFYVGLNVDGTLPERDSSNNFALYGRQPHRLYLPSVWQTE